MSAKGLLVCVCSPFLSLARLTLRRITVTNDRGIVAECQTAANAMSRLSLLLLAALALLALLAPTLSHAENEGLDLSLDAAMDDANGATFNTST